MKHFRISLLSTVLVIVAIGVGIPALRQATADSGPAYPPLAFVGPIVSLPSATNLVGDWTVGRRTVHVSAATTIDQDDAAAVVGALVVIQGTTRADNSIDATKIEVKLPPPPQPTPGASPSPRPSPGPPFPGAQCISLFGPIQVLPNTTGFVGDWTVGQKIVHVTASTTIKTEEGAVAIGAFVEVKGCLRTDGSLDAGLIEVEKTPTSTPPFFEFFGAIQSLPTTQNLVGDWTVGGRTVHVTATTRVDQNFRALVVGAFVEVRGALQSDNSINAASIKVRRSPDTGPFVNFTELHGDVQSLPSGSTLVGDWKVKDVIVHVSASTKIAQSPDHPVAVGSRVVVVGTKRADLSIDAARIRVLDSVEPAQTFVSQNYEDFLSRDADAPGLAYWTDQINRCGTDADCVRQQRISVSAAFFYSPEFQLTGYLVYRYYEASFGRAPQLVEFSPDVQSLAQNIANPAVLEANKQTFSDDWVDHPAFATLYDNKSDAEYVDILYANAGVTPNQGTRDQLVRGLSLGSETRATVLRQVVEDATFAQQEFDNAFVLMQYFGYLRRDPESAGYDFWVDVLSNREPNNFRGMVCAFITSAEYQLRFSNTVSHSNQECGQ